MIRGIIICFVFGDILIFFMLFIRSCFFVVEFIVKNLIGFMCDVSLLIVSMLLGSKVLLFNGLVLFDIIVIWYFVLFVICRRIENKLEDGGNIGGIFKVKKIE